MIRPYIPPREMFNGIALVGEAPGETEVEQGTPFVGASGKELTAMLETAGIARHQCYITNVFLERPPGNDISQFCCKKVALPTWYNLPPLSMKTGYVRPEHLHNLKRLKQELEEQKPTIVVALGNTALWALCGVAAVSKVRGTVTESSLIPGTKILPTYHPAMVLRAWQNRSIVITDLMKARRESAFSEIRTPNRELWLEPSLNDLYDYENWHIKDSYLLAFDIETTGNKFITCIGFSPSPSSAIVVPFHDPRKPDKHYWPTLTDELAAWEWVQHILSLPIAKVGQNGLYDIQYLLRHGIVVRNYQHDTMLLHHSLFPEMEKGLAFLGSVYTDEQAWKLLRPRNKDQAVKRDD